MTNVTPRYDLICDPLDRWIVWDHVTESPASFGGRILDGLDEQEASRLADVMNELQRRQQTLTDRAGKRSAR
ncbi:hypothetical protein N2599_05580 [Rhizobium sullae]|uniref:Transcriptional regulator n=1 Tax=Rhizobium sullae TaxID=50338 RepID=A0ABY5XMT7_RHISU|nr:hypothetical protein [Rhizobium sullae]UWU15474.1 hypothetical protein N2599_05580 [Rhizobium sullae]